MGLFVMILRKMLNNKALEISLCFGMVMAVTLVSSMPIYKGGILNKMLMNNLQNIQTNSHFYPGTLWFSVDFSDSKKPAKTSAQIHQADQYIQSKLSQFHLPVLQYVPERDTGDYALAAENPKQVNIKKGIFGSVGALKGMERHVKLINGRLPADHPVNGVYEALVTSEMLQNLQINLGDVIEFKNEGKTLLKVKPVGEFTTKSKHTLFWYNAKLSAYASTFLINFNLFENDFTTGNVLPVKSSYWYTALDYTHINLEKLPSFGHTAEQINGYMFNAFQSHYMNNIPAYSLISSYDQKSKQLNRLLVTLNLPVLIMLGFFIYAISNLIMERQKTEIAVIKSRGAFRWQIVLVYLLEGAILGAVAFAVGPFLGEFLTKVLGAPIGFMQLNQRIALYVRLGRSTFEYAGAAVGLSILMMIIPAIRASKVSIVTLKQQQSLYVAKSSLWHKFYVDVLFLAIAFYEYHNFQSELKDLGKLGLNTQSITFEPVLFLVPALFMIGFGLFVLRLYPWVLRLVYWCGKNGWKPSAYSILIQVGRQNSQYQFLMVFLILTVATGMFSASADRTINGNVTDQIRYKNGADMVLDTMWDNNAPLNGNQSAPGGDTSGSSANSVNAASGPSPQPILYREPPFQPFEELPGVESAAKVFTKQKASFSKVRDGSQASSVTLMGIDTYEFGKTTWFKPGLSTHPFFSFLNLLSKNPQAVLISGTLAAKEGVHVGDVLYVGWQGVQPQPVVVSGIVNYFPTFNPNPSSDGNGPKTPMLIVGNLNYIQNNLALEPYQVWLKLKPGASRVKLYQELSKSKTPIVSMTDTIQEIKQSKKNPFIEAINGVMTLGFMISILISFFGYVLYWGLMLVSRVLQFGTMRAMGVTFGQLLKMLIIEQVLTSGVAIVLGSVTGWISSRIFVPMFQIAFNPSSMVPPFQVIMNIRDSEHLYEVITVMIVTALVILGVMVSRIKIHQAVKLGED